MTRPTVLPRMVDILDGVKRGMYLGEANVNYNALVLWYKPLTVDPKFNGLIKHSVCRHRQPAVHEVYQ